MDQEKSDTTGEPREPKTRLKKPSKQTLLTVALIVMTILTATLASALVLEMNAHSGSKDKIHDLEGSIQNLESTIDDLEDQKADLQVEKRSLEDQVGILLNLTYDQDGQISALQSQITNLTSQISDLQNQITTLQNEKAALEAQLTALQNENQNLTAENDEWQRLFDMRTGHYLSDMITPDDPAVVFQSQQILGPDADGNLTWSDMRAINDWVFINILPSTDPPISSPSGGAKDYWLLPNETLLRGEGDSEDQANLALSLMLAEQNATFVWAGLVNFTSGTSHVGIFVNVVNDTMYIFDPMWGWESTTNQNESAALTEWAIAGGETGVDLVRAAYLDIECVEFTTLQEFYDWF